ncbi:MAG: type II secretion system F family protein [Candidatus Schekmanbacteria bacterium]|nr:type II secretion system F family protein [Candidatus Schekmanbacteria bacterium]
MAAFKYRALDAQGRERAGTITSASERAAMEQLRRDGLYPIALKEGSGLGGRRVRRNRLALQATLLRQLASLLRAGFPVVRALEAIAEQCDDSGARARLNEMREAIRGGASLADAAAGHQALLGALFPPLARVGERVGSLPEVVDRLANAAERRRALADNVRSALAYPLFMAVVAVLVTLFLVGVVIPSTQDIFKQLGGQLPLPTRLVFGAANALASPPGALTIAALAAGVAAALSRPKWRARLTARLQVLALLLPVVAPLVLLSEAALWSQAMAALQPGGVPVAEALEAARGALRFAPLRGELLAVSRAVTEGTRLATAIGGLPFPPLLRHMIALGEESGRLGELLDAAAKTFESELETRLRSSVALIEPALILVMGVVVGVLAVALVLPLYDISTTLSSAYR